MAVVRRSLRLTALDVSRVETLRDRCGPGVSASEAVRVAIRYYLSRLPLEDVSHLAQQLAAEAQAEGGATRTWGFSLPDEEQAALETAVAAAPAGVLRRWSRTEIVRLAVLLLSQASNEDLARTHAALPKVTRGRPPAVAGDLG